MPKSLGSTEFTLYLGSIFFLRTASSDTARRSRGPRRSAGVSFMPSGIHTLLRQVLPRALPMAAPISRERIPCSIQNWQVALSALLSVIPPTTLEWAKKVGLKSRPILMDRAHAIDRKNFV